VDLPLDARTLLQTLASNPSSAIRALENGEFHYFGIKNGIFESVKLRILNFQYPFFKDTKDLLTLRIGVDGLPLSKSSKSQVWPIMGILDKSINQSVFLIAIYHGKSKPEDLSAYLADFVSEMKTLQADGIEINGVHYLVKISLLLYY
jgi:hypothetical protein